MGKHVDTMARENVESSIGLLNNVVQPQCSIYEVNENGRTQSDIMILNYNTQLNHTGIVTDKNAGKHGSTGDVRNGPTIDHLFSVSRGRTTRDVEHVLGQSDFNELIKMRHNKNGDMTKINTIERQLAWRIRAPLA